MGAEISIGLLTSFSAGSGSKGSFRLQYHLTKRKSTALSTILLLSIRSSSYAFRCLRKQQRTYACMRVEYATRPVSRNSTRWPRFCATYERMDGRTERWTGRRDRGRYDPHDTTDATVGCTEARARTLNALGRTWRNKLIVDTRARTRSDSDSDSRRAPQTDRPIARRTRTELWTTRDRDDMHHPSSLSPLRYPIPTTGCPPLRARSQVRRGTTANRARTSNEFREIHMICARCISRCNS